MSFTPEKSNSKPIIALSRHRTKVWFISGVAVLISLIGFVCSWLDPEIGLPLRPGLDFTGGTQIRLERKCQNNCKAINTSVVNDALRKLSSSNNDSSKKFLGARIQFLDEYKSLSVRLPSLSASESKSVIESISNVAGPFVIEGQSVETIGPALGAKLLKTTLVSLLAAFSCVALYISLRFDRRFSFFALLALLHDVLIVCGIFSWLGILLDLEVNSLFAVSLLTIAGYSVNDTVVVFDRIREINKQESILSSKQKIDLAVSATLTRTLYTSGTTLLPLLALIFFGGDTLYWFAIALAIGVVVGSWSSIALVPSLLNLKKDK
ncbi:MULTISPECIES: protein translocase subunit SecF [unclassified Prochlorococcus]|uniref:protein translocase subunit SecF n=1 Tax=unclassified Prochlorococcus TaxID=2627481 RepID=UPI0005338AC7|nr:MULTISPECIES: protein translocase subunit SecF [unclassified Prochlorococcus]KGG15082.1 Protein-export membrane protein SecF [Prochlorococcus sp. MIT 0602]KGG17354.1 Protein-export membrane protein SecF [Prochlorococcus sp. MIT 0603]